MYPAEAPDRNPSRGERGGDDKSRDDVEKEARLFRKNVPVPEARKDCLEMERRNRDIFLLLQGEMATEKCDDFRLGKDCNLSIDSKKGTVKKIDLFLLGIYKKEMVTRGCQ